MAQGGTFMGTTNKVVRNSECANPSSHCREVADTLPRIGGKWTVMVVGALSMEEPLRYNEISRKKQITCLACVDLMLALRPNLLKCNGDRGGLSLPPLLG